MSKVKLTPFKSLAVKRYLLISPSLINDVSIGQERYPGNRRCIPPSEIWKIFGVSHQFFNVSPFCQTLLTALETILREVAEWKIVKR